ncbi:hypothetical protein PHSY_003281 [Pseudozyma hubeiensis SY62]|uniref:Uncharacterized protein n=1 Tax=Pseudozyma hubeiensis (strain SY62) TaxID=1305764 RepID=R9PC99_PSEHS|nr:hypothetical protein PHSY_003281 [Pseudozyma hubeiensis SY62]GAC95705.1 hypothetical protein PHSY_003281 [Pseudozyma hubeiensis SY62]
MTLEAAGTIAVSSDETKPNVHLSPSDLSQLSLQVYPHTSSPPIPTSTLETFVDLINAAFSGPIHSANFGSKSRYSSTAELVDDLNRGEGGWMFLLVSATGIAVAGAKVTLGGEGMDGGASEVVFPNPYYTPLPAQGKIYWLGALGSITTGTGSILLDGIKAFLAQQSPRFTLKAYTVTQWDQGPGGLIQPPEHNALVKWFERERFEVVDYAWKEKGTWGSFYGGWLCGIVYTHGAEQKR